MGYHCCRPPARPRPRHLDRWHDARQDQGGQHGARRAPVARNGAARRSLPRRGGRGGLALRVRRRARSRGAGRRVHGGGGRAGARGPALRGCRDARAQRANDARRRAAARTREQAQRWLRAIHREGRRLSMLTENILLHARGERRATRAAPQWTDVGASYAMRSASSRRRRRRTRGAARMQGRGLVDVYFRPPASPERSSYFMHSPRMTDQRRHASTTTPTVTSAIPIHSRVPGRSPRNRTASTATSTTLNLSTGATFAASPTLSARK
jgi:hypothetical protein